MPRSTVETRPPTTTAPGVFARLWGIVHMSSIFLLVLWTGIALAGLAGVVVSTNNIRFQHRVSHEAHLALKAAAGACPIDGADFQALPMPVQRYLSKAIGTRRQAARTARIQQNGAFRPDLKGKWVPIKGEQYFTADPPGFIWWGRVRIALGIWIDARDRSVGGVGNMLVKAESTFQLADAAGPELDQGALLRLLGELAWLPTAYLDRRYIRWSSVDDRHASATLTVAGREVTGAFEFGDDELPSRYTAERFRDVGGGKSVLTPFLGECRDYRRVEGMLVPHEMVGSWVIDGTPQPYARFNVVRLEFDAVEPY